MEEIGGRLCNHFYTSAVNAAAGLHWLSTCREAFLFENCVEDRPVRRQVTLETVSTPRTAKSSSPTAPAWA